jgi:alpha-ribazole phosphatase
MKRRSPAGATYPPICPTPRRSSRLDAFLPADAIVVASDLTRASATADRIAGKRARLPDMPQLREFDFGAWDGLDFAAVAARDPELSRAFWDTPGDVAAPNGESFNAVGARASTAIEGLARDHPGTDLIAVAHMGVIMAHIGLSAGLGLKAALSHQIEPLSVTCLDRIGEDGPSGWSITSPDGAHQRSAIDLSGMCPPYGTMTYKLLIGQRGHSSWSLRGWLPFAVFDIDVAVQTTRIYSDAFKPDVAAFGGAGTVPVVKTPTGAS